MLATRRFRFFRFARPKWRACRRGSAASRSPASWATRSGCPPIASARCTQRCWRQAETSVCATFGARALHSLRLEKSFGNWAREYRPIYSPSEAGLDRFIDLNKGDFIGRAAALRERDAGPERRLVTLVVDAADADAIGDEPVWHDGQVVGWVTSGGYGHCVGKSIALAYVPASLADAANGFEVEILGERRAASLTVRPLHDPTGSRMRLS